MRIKRDGYEIVEIEYLRRTIENIVLRYRLDVMDKNLAINRPIWNGEVAAIVSKDDVAARALPLIGLIKSLVQISVPAECRVRYDAVKLEIVEAALEVRIEERFGICEHG